MYLVVVALFVVANIFMSYAWYGHLKNLKDSPLWVAIFVSWGIALLEYCFQVPANRLGRTFWNLEQLKILQEVITLVVFVGFSWWSMGEPISKNFLAAGVCLCGAVYFIFARPF